MNKNIETTKQLVELQNNSKTELAHFKKILEASRAKLGNGYLYEECVAKMRIYQATFGALAVLFFYLAGAIYPKSFTWSASFLMGSLLSTKTLIIAGCIGIGALCSMIGLWLCPIKEFTRLKVSKTYRELWKIHEERKLKKRIPWYTDCKEKLHLKSVLHHLYHDVCDKIDDAGRETITLVEAIKKKEKMTAEYKERLIEQAFDELDSKLLNYQTDFRSAWIE